jgi:hypothetical protein
VDVDVQLAGDPVGDQLRNRRHTVIAAQQLPWSCA